MIQERSEEVSIPDSMRSNLTNQGLVAALFLTIVMFMVQARTHPSARPSPHGPSARAAADDDVTRPLAWQAAPPQVDQSGGNATLLAQWCATRPAPAHLASHSERLPRMARYELSSPV